ncbi:GrpB family protein [Hymenobacter sp. YC55]|uniref:GrpB family protein n=1 Tax=Hymenobacter sp. YC55 TaxID=3034019 RepID=UPI0023F922D9|nr:GrpB family protein [Hymenobacter sp. YC55]MDF7815899.1 GrpB family protein [Hymenobacter sp. YC55]
MGVELVPYDPRWSQAYAQEALALHHALGDTVLAIHHVGSTAIPGILAKPIIDILCVVVSLAAVDAGVHRLQSLGYLAKGEGGIVGRRYFQKKNQRGVRSHHGHVFRTGSTLERHLAFRDFLLAHPATAARYSAVKPTALATLPLTRQAYQNWKRALYRLDPSAGDPMVPPAASLIIRARSTEADTCPNRLGGQCRADAGPSASGSSSGKRG